MQVQLAPLSRNISVENWSNSKEGCRILWTGIILANRKIRIRRYYLTQVSFMKKAFTLIELLVVIAIIAILAAILFPVFAQAKMAAKRTAALSNTKQMLLASQMYAIDYDDMYHLIRARVDTGDPLNWAFGAEDALNPYIKSYELQKDPSDSVTRDDCGTPTGGTTSFSWTHYRNDDIRTFGVHGYNAPTWTPAQARPSLTTTAVGAPAQTINMYPLWTTASYKNGYAYYRYYTDDLGPRGPIPTFPRALSFTWCSASPGAGRMSIGAYNDVINYGFADGHAKGLKRDTTMGNTSHPWTATNVTNRTRNLFHYDDAFKQ